MAPNVDVNQEPKETWINMCSLDGASDCDSEHTTEPNNHNVSLQFVRELAGEKLCNFASQNNAPTLNTLSAAIWEHHVFRTKRTRVVSELLEIHAIWHSAPKLHGAYTDPWTAKRVINYADDCEETARNTNHVDDGLRQVAVTISPTNVVATGWRHVMVRTISVTSKTLRRHSPSGLLESGQNCILDLPRRTN